MGKTIAVEIYGSSLVGNYAYANDSFCLIGATLPSEIKDSYKKALDVPLIDITIGGSSQVGLYIVGASNHIFVPTIITEKEEDILKTHNIAYTKLDTTHTALGNNIVLNDTYCFHIPHLESFVVKQISETLSIPTEPLVLPDFEVIGSIIVITKKGGLIQKDVPIEVKEDIEKKFQCSLEQGTVNFGSSVLGGGIVVNSNGMVIGKASAGIEVTNADMAFGFLD